MKNYTCAICGTEHFNLDSYLKCVAKCGETLRANNRAEEEKKKLEEVNNYLTQIKKAKIYYENLLVEFQMKYPEEYKMNFGKSITTDDDSKLTYDEDVDTWVKESGVFTFSYEDNGKDKPVIKANGKDITNDPELNYIVKLLGLFD
jgi:hypothetical protein